MKKILFITGTRADYGKIKPLLYILENSKDFEVYIFVCGMHLSEKLGSTSIEIIEDGYKNIYIANELKNIHSHAEKHGKTICALNNYVQNVKPDMIIIHGDRMDALAGATVGALNNIIVAHIEGGELSGTIDESIRHAISKFAHIHFVCNESAKKRLIQMGEEERRIYVIGSPDIDIMLSKSLPTIETVKNRYDILFKDYAILMYHPVTTEAMTIKDKINRIIEATIKTNLNYVVIYPNDDLGSEEILTKYKQLENNTKYKLLPSMRFEYFLTLLKNANFIIGNSSAGIREAGVYGIPTIDIGTRQKNRYSEKILKNVMHTNESEIDIIKAINDIDKHKYKISAYGDGHSTEKFLNILSNEKIFEIQLQKHFIDLDF